MRIHRARTSTAYESPPRSVRDRRLRGARRPADDAGSPAGRAPSTSGGAERCGRSVSPSRRSSDADHALRDLRRAPIGPNCTVPAPSRPALRALDMPEHSGGWLQMRPISQPNRYAVALAVSSRARERLLRPYRHMGSVGYAFWGTPRERGSKPCWPRRLEASPFCARRADERRYRDIDVDAGSTRVAVPRAAGGRRSGPGSHVMGSVGPCLMVFIPICDRALLTPGSAARRLV